ncbi:MAG: hypothetical protein E6G10_28240 [Actinobacteria bacterium]|nr:MAG: hypothetical protein E6G10_28240 [Actinomycetota bacterium]
MSTGPRPLGRAAVATYGTTVLVAALSLGNVLVVGRALGPSGRGSVAFLTTVTYLVAQLATLGIAQANVNFAGREPASTPRLATNSVLLAAAGGSLAAGLTLALMALVPAAGGPVGSGLRWLALATVPAVVLGVLLYQLAVAHFAFTASNVSSLIAPILNVTANGAFAAAGVLSIRSAVIVWLAGQLANTLFTLWYVTTRLGGWGRLDLALARRTLSFGLKAHIGSVLSLANYRIDQWLMGALTSARQIGLYSIAVSWSEALFFLPTALAQVQRPNLVRDDPAGAARQTAVVFRAAVVITIALAIAVALLAPVLCTTIFGPRFADSVPQLRILTIGSLGIVATKLLGNALVAQGRPLRQTLAILSSFVVILVLDVALIPSLGGVGASIASAGAYAVGGLVVVAVFARTFGLPASELVPRPSDVTALVRNARALARRSTAAA